MTQDSNQEQEILMTDDEGNVIAPETAEASLDMKKGAKGLELAAKALEKGKDNKTAIDTVAAGVYAARSEKIQGLWDWLSEDTKRNLLRADDRNALMQAIEKWFPQLDYRNLTDPMGKETLRNVLSGMAILGLIDVDPQILKDMRAMPGSGFLQVPDAVISGTCSVLGAPELSPILLAAKKLGQAGEGLGDKVRARVEELKRADELKQDRQKMHHDMDEALPDNVVPMHAKYPPDEDSRMAA
ncbi:MAG: hypothetical protein AAB802_05225 [Patescibacteria group bacterium]